MNQIQDPPLDYDFGLEFNYAVWTANTKLDLCNVPWNNDYRDIVKFPNRAALDTYITNAALTGVRIENSRYAPATRPIRVSLPFNKAIKYNYIRASNPAQPLGAGVDEARSFYYFITDVKYIAPQTTELTVQLDVWQTYGFDTQFGNCYITRGHIGVANSNRMRNYGRDFLTIPEGLDTGSDYMIHYTSQETVMLPFGADITSILVSSTVDLEADPGTVAAPKIVAAKGGTFSLLASGATYYVFKNSTSFQMFLNGIRDTPWVAQGITSITVIPNVARYWSGFAFNADGVPTKAPTNAPNAQQHNMLSNFRNQLIAPLPAKYKHLDKFKTYPYSVIELTTWSATPIMIKPELWNQMHAIVREHANLIPPSQRIIFMPFGYNAATELDSSGMISDNGEGFDFATMIQSLPTVAIVNNMSSNYLAANAAGIAFQHQNADWSQQKALAGASTSYDQATSAMQMMDRMAMTGRNADIAQTALTNRTMNTQAAIGLAGGVGSGLAQGALGGPAGMAAGAAGGVMGGAANAFNSIVQQGANTEALGIRNMSGVQNIQDQLGNSAFQRDSNQDLATFAAKGDYENTIAGINAKVQDSKFVQPTTSGQVGGDTLNLVHFKSEVAMRLKIVDQARMKTIGDYWLRYGYAVNQFATPPASLMTMSNFTYWKMQETYLIASGMPEGFKTAIRGIFEKGVTVWTDPAKIGTIDISDNAILGGISL